MLYLLYLFIRKIELPHYYASLKLLYFNVQKFKILGQSILKVIQAFHTECIVLYNGCSGPVIRSSTAYILIVFKPSTTVTMSLTTQLLRTARMACNFANNKQKYAKFSITSLIRILHCVMPLYHNI